LLDWSKLDDKGGLDDVKLNDDENIVKVFNLHNEAIQQRRVSLFNTYFLNTKNYK